MRDRYASEAAVRARLEPLIAERWPGSHLELDASLRGEFLTIWVVKGESPLGATLAHAKEVLVSELLEKDDPGLRSWLKTISN